MYVCFTHVAAVAVPVNARGTELDVRVNFMLFFSL
jgi:hypothetical protein